MQNKQFKYPPLSSQLKKITKSVWLDVETAQLKRLFMLLFSRGFAAASWGWRHRMRFVDHESDEYLRELVHYVQQHSGLDVFLFSKFDPSPNTNANRATTRVGAVSVLQRPMPQGRPHHRRHGCPGAALFPTGPQRPVWPPCRVVHRQRAAQTRARGLYASRIHVQTDGAFF